VTLARSGTAPPADDLAMTAGSTSTNGAGGRRWWRVRLHVLLLLGVLPPLAGVAGLAGVLIHERWSERQQSMRIEERAGLLGELADLRALLAEEEAHTTAVVLAESMDLPGLDLESSRSAMGDARAQVDATVDPAEVPDLAAGLRALEGLRRAVDDGSATQAEVDGLYTELQDRLEDRWRGALVDIEAVAEDHPLPSDVRARVRAVRETVAAFTQGGPRVDAAIGLLLRDPTAAATQDLIEATTRFDAAEERALPYLGPRARAAWDLFRTEPAAVRTERLLDAAIAVGLGNAPSPLADGGIEVGSALDDGARWAILLAGPVQGAARDLEAAAHTEVVAATWAVVRDGGVALVVIAVSLVLVLLIARELLAPAMDLEAAARRVQHGEFEIAPVPPRGPREITATVRAFNDMAATLAAVEAHAVALAEDPTSPTLDHPLPGRTGHAMQLAIDRLRSSVRETDRHRAELAEMAARDGLTGLLNRNTALEAIALDLARARREGSVLMVLFVDLDGLKWLNDTYGHAAGDAALVTLAEVLATTTRDADVVARLGGDEFLVAGLVAPGDAGEREVHALAERLLVRIAEQDVELGAGERAPLRASIGVATSSPDLATTEALVRAADAALYEAKRAGRSRVAYFSAAR
jgi:diguanylate cyclase (GGDEF)-like protein